MLDADAIPHCPSAAKRKANNHSSAASKSRHKSTSTPSTGNMSFMARSTSSGEASLCHSDPFNRNVSDKCLCKMPMLERTCWYFLRKRMKFCQFTRHPRFQARALHYPSAHPSLCPWRHCSTQPWNPVRLNTTESLRELSLHLGCARGCFLPPGGRCIHVISRASKFMTELAMADRSIVTCWGTQECFGKTKAGAAPSPKQHSQNSRSI